MSTMLSLVLFWIAGAILAVVLKARGTVQLFVTSYVASAGMVLISGYFLSTINRIDQLTAWTSCSLAFVLVVLMAARLIGARPQATARRAYRRLRRDVKRFRQAHRNKNFYVRMVGAFMIVYVIAQLSVVLICCLPPENGDSLSCFLPRMAHYIQQGNLEFYDSNYIAQTVHFKNATVLQIHMYLTTGSNESMVQFVSWGCSWLATISVLGIAAMIWKNNIAALFSMLVFGLLTINIMLAATPQVDMPITGFIGATVYFLMCFFRENRYIWLVMSSVAAAIAFGIKASALLLVPSLAIVALAGFVDLYRTKGIGVSLNSVAVASLVGIVSFVMFMLPAGYHENWNRYGHIMGPDDWRKVHVFDNLSVNEQIKVGTANAARYAIHFIGNDGIPNGNDFVQLWLRLPMAFAFELAGIEIYSSENVRQPFVIDSDLKATSDRSYWGPATYLIVAPAIVVVLIRFYRGPFPVAFIAAGLLYFLAQSYTSLYDPWRGRSFANLAVFLVPLIGCLFLKRVGELKPNPQRLSKRIWIAVASIVLLAGVGASLTRVPTAIQHLSRSSDRIAYLSRSDKGFEDRIRRYESLVPPGATVWLTGVSPILNYPLYGERLNRKIVFTNPAEDGSDIDFKIFSEANEAPVAEDIPLDLEFSPSNDGRWFLRTLSAVKAAKDDSNRSNSLKR